MAVLNLPITPARTPIHTCSPAPALVSESSSGSRSRFPGMAAYATALIVLLVGLPAGSSVWYTAGETFSNVIL